MFWKAKRKSQMCIRNGHGARKGITASQGTGLGNNSAPDGIFYKIPEIPDSELASTGQIFICWGLLQMLTSVPLWKRDFFNNRINLGYFEQSPSIYLPDSPLEAQRIARGQLWTRFLPQEFILCPAKRGSGPPWWFTVMFTQTQALLSAWGLWWLFVSLLQTQTITLNPNLRIFPGGFACAV